MKLTVKKLFNNYFLLFVLMFPFLEPRCLYDMESMEVIHYYFTLWRYYTAIIIIILGILTIKNISKYCWMVNAFLLVVAVATYANNTGNASYVFKLQITAIGFCILVDLALQFSPKKIVNIFAAVFSLLTIANFVTLFLFPNGMYSTVSLNGRWYANWLFGFRNLFIFSLLPTLFFVAICRYFENNKLNWMFWCILGISAFSVCSTGSITSGLSILLIAVLLVSFERRDLTFVLNSRNYLYASLAISWALISASIIPFLSQYMVIINRDINTMSNRTFIWQRALNAIKEMLLLGHGREVETQIYNNIGAYHAHNQWLDVLYIGGLIALVVYVFLFFCASKKIREIPDIRFQNAINSIILGYFILFLTEARRDDLYHYVIMITIYHIPQLIKIATENTKKSRRKKYAIRFR